MMSPLDALSALTHVQVPAAVTPTAAPLGSSANASETFQNMLQPAPDAAATQSVAATGTGSPATWGHMVQQMVMDVNSKQQNANALVSDVLKGGPTPVHEAMIATEESSLSFELLAEMRNKVVDAYQQVMQMNV